MRKLIGINGAWIKTDHKGVLIVATTQESEYHTYPIAWGLVDSENNVSLTWFLEKLKKLIPDSLEITFISDRNQCIHHAVCQIYPMAHHGACCFNVKHNIKHKFKNSAPLKYYTDASATYCIEEYTVHFNEIRKDIQGWLSF